ncbi:MAG: ABC transporter ATP-binding protein [Candidatus Bipolaricaulaceae bacterium]
MGDPLVLVERLRGYYVGGFGVVHGVDDVSLTLHEGEAVGLVGESGCGKSTLAQLITGVTGPVLHYQGGTVLVDGYNVYAIPEETLRTEVLCKRLAYIPQAAMDSLNPVKRIRDLLRDVVRERTGRMPSKEEILSTAGEHFESLGLSRSVLNFYPHEMSGGMKQRVVVAISTLWNPKILVVDEPTSALDVSSQKLLVRTLMLLRQRGTVRSMLFITHDIPVARQICETMAVMYCGQLVEVGSVEEVLEAPRHPYTRGLLASIASYEPHQGRRTRLESIPGRPPDMRNPPPGCRFHPRCSLAQPRCAQQEPPEVTLAGKRMVRCWRFAGGG